MFKIGALFIVVHACLLAGSNAYNASSNVYQGEAYHNNTSGKRVKCDSVNLDNKDLLLATVSVLRNSTAGCDTCIRVQGPQGNIVAKVAEQCHDCEENFVQLTTEAFNKIHTANSSLAQVSWEVVDCALLGSDVHQELPGADKDSTTADSEDDDGDSDEEDAEDDDKDGGNNDCEDNCDKLQNDWLKGICRRACQYGNGDNPERPVNPRWLFRNWTTRGGVNNTSYNVTNSTGQQSNSTLNISNLVKNWASNNQLNASTNGTGAAAGGGDYSCSAWRQCPESSHCCSKYGYCGTSSEHCGAGCIGGACLSGSNNATQPNAPTSGSAGSGSTTGGSSGPSGNDNNSGGPSYGSSMPVNNSTSGGYGSSLPGNNNNSGGYGSSLPGNNGNNGSGYGSSLPASNTNGATAADCPTGGKPAGSVNGSNAGNGTSYGGSMPTNGTSGCPIGGSGFNTSAGCLPQQLPSGNSSTPLSRTNLTASTTLLSNSSTTAIVQSTTTTVVNQTPYVPFSDVLLPIGESVTESRSETASTSTAADAPSTLLSAVLGMIVIIAQFVLV
ncbi:hypothetical protein MP228_008920 [Amoeboaphelidium protococcarum]|nr:hypothetical protein MP228_008920 [Amoeboaphelidium protococcarum]